MAKTHGHDFHVPATLFCRNSWVAVRVEYLVILYVIVFQKISDESGSFAEGGGEGE